MTQVLVYGGNGQLGQAVVKELKAKDAKIYSVDFASNADADVNILIKGNMAEDATEVASHLEGVSLNAVIAVAGGWAGGSIARPSVFEAVDKMWRYNTQSSVVAAHIAARFLRQGGLLVLTGASAALSGTHGMIGYGLSKAAVHQLVASLAESNSGLPADATTVAILPITLDTESNRQGMPHADFSSWTPLSEVTGHSPAQKISDWVHGSGRPASGSLVEVVTSAGVTTFKTASVSVTREVTP